MAAPLILARTFKDAHTYAREELGLSTGYYRVVNSAGTIKAVRNADIHLVPGWTKRPDRFTMQSALKWCRLNIIDVEKVRESAAAFDAIRVTPNRPEDGRWLNTEYTQTIATRFHRIHFIKFVPTKIVVTSVPDETPIPQHHLDMIETVAPHLIDTSNGDNMIAEGSPTIVNDEVKALDAAAPKKRRRTKCKMCEQMHYKGDPCVDSEAV